MAIQDVISTVLRLQGESAYSSGLMRASGAVGQLEAAQSRLERQQRAGNLIGGVALAGAAGIGRMVAEAGKLQQVEIGFTTVLGSAEKARAKIAELQAFAARTPFNFAQTAQGARMLLTMGTAAEDLIPIMEGVGGAVAAAGGSTEEFVGSLRAIGQIRTKGRLQTEELLQLAERGVPAFEILREELNLTQEQMQRLGNQGIEAGAAIDALTRGFTKRFGGSLEAQNKSLVGSFSNLQDAAQMAAVRIGKPWLDPTIAVTRGVAGLIDRFNKLPESAHHTAGILAGVVVAGLGAVSARLGIAALQTGRLITENARLTNESLKARGGTDALSLAERTLAAQLGLTGASAFSLTGRTLILARAHDTATAAAWRQVAAEKALGGTVGGNTGGGLPGRLPRPGEPGARPQMGPGAWNRQQASAPRPGEPGARPQLPPSGVTSPAATPARPVGIIERVKHMGRGLFGGRPDPNATIRPGATTPLNAAELARQHAAQAEGAGKGLAGRLGGSFMRGLKGGAIGIGTAIAADLALGLLPEGGKPGALKDIGQGALSGALAGGAIGLIPGLQPFAPFAAAAGGLAGGIATGAGMLAGGGIPAEPKAQAKGGTAPATDKPMTLLERQNARLIELMEENNQLLGHAKEGRSVLGGEVISPGKELELLSGRMRAFARGIG